jgi:hypothetical protein
MSLSYERQQQELDPSKNSFFYQLQTSIKKPGEEISYFL